MRHISVWVVEFIKLLGVKLLGVKLLGGLRLHPRIVRGQPIWRALRGQDEVRRLRRPDHVRSSPERTPKFQSAPLAR